MEEHEKTLLSDLGRELLKEMRRKRRWNVVFRVFYLLVVVAIIGFAARSTSTNVTDVFESHVALVRAEGIIAPDFPASARRVNDALRRAFENAHSVGVILEMNTPGGSPVQASRIASEIERLRADNEDKTIHVVISDVCVSAGMYIASAGENIYADRSSVVGSLGVVMSNFGFVDAMEELGIERRLLTAGKHKAMLDPFIPENEKETAHMQHILDSVHEQFKQQVRRGRGARLSETPDLFSGLIWTGEQAKELGLIDDFGTRGSVAREVFKTDNIVEYTPQEPIWRSWGLRVKQFVREVLREPWTGGRYYTVPVMGS